MVRLRIDDTPNNRITFLHDSLATRFDCDFHSVLLLYFLLIAHALAIATHAAMIVTVALHLLSKKVSRLHPVKSHDAKKTVANTFFFMFCTLNILPV